MNFSYVTGNLSISLKRGVITCIPKQNKCRFYLKNWRPISLLNAVYKLAASCIANRIKPVLGQIINENQKGFIKGRYIGENICMVYDALFYAKLQHKPGLLLLIDFEKAFDSISWKFLQETLHKFNFGPSMQKWTHLFYNDIQSCVLQNGFLSSFFPISRGCRQGDPLSPYLFTLAVGILAIMIRNNTKIKSLRINGLEIKLGQYADDTQIVLDGSEEALNLTLKVLEKIRLTLLSGLKINMEKKKAVWIGSMINSNLRLCSKYNLDWVISGSFNVFGINMNADLSDIWEINLTKKRNEIRSLLARWGRRRLSIIGRITLMKSFALSKLVYLFLCLPTPTLPVLKDNNHLFYTFIWQDKPDKIKRDTLQQPFIGGGLGMINIEQFLKSLKLTWLRRTIKESLSWHFAYHQIVKKSPFLWATGSNYLQTHIKYIDNPFWKYIFVAYISLIDKIRIECYNEIVILPIWFNNHFIDGHMCIYNWAKQGILFIKDILTEDGTFFKFSDLKHFFKIKGTYLDYIRLQKTCQKRGVVKLIIK